MTTVITVYDREQDDGPVPLGPAHVLHRAVGRPASFGWVDLGEVADDLAPDVVRSAASDPTALTGRYQAFHLGEIAAQAYGEAPVDPVIFVNCIRFAPQQHDAAFEAWQQVNRYMVAKPGYRWHRLHRRLDDDAPFGLVNVVEWESPEAWRAAHDEGFHALTRGDLPFTTHPTLCRPVASPVTQG
jgi:heme-degrading monooxygenase HmoA